MPPLPKHPSVRRRRNKSTSAATLTLVHDVEAPELPDTVTWLPATLDWWRDVWASPMAPEYDDSDRHGLFILALLVNAFWTEPTKELAGEIRLQRQAFGLSPLDRRRLEWEVERGESASEKREQRRTVSKPRAVPKVDPRRMLTG